MRFYGVVLLCLGGIAAKAHAVESNIATLSCAKYQNEFMASSGGDDPINTMMWLFGYSVAHSGAHVMYGDALAGFGFALDAECKDHPAESLLQALAAIRPDAKNPMDLTALECQTFAARHLDLVKSDAESAKTIMMWLFGFAAAKSGSRIFEASGVGAFEAALMSDCRKYPARTLFDALAAVKAPKSK